jgi:hypothetical protein
VINIRRNCKNERVDTSTLQDLAMRIGQSAHICVSFVAGQNELNLVEMNIRLRSTDAFRSLTFDEVPDSLRKPVNTEIW